MSEEHKITAGTISGATLKSIDIEPSIIIEGKSYTASEFNKAVEMLKQPQLNDNQKIVLEWLKYPLNDIPNRFAKDYFAYVTCLFLGQAPDKVLKAYQELSLEQRRQVLAAFAQWGLEQEEAE